MEIDVVQAIFLGLVQGLTEFFPVSSSGHLVLFHEILGVEGSMTFDIILHAGTLAAVFAVFRKELLSLLKPPFNRLLLLILASVPAALVGLLLSDRIETLFGTTAFLPLFFLVTAALLLTAERVTARRAAPPKPLGLKSAVIMGLAQGAAVLPGISRSGSTICAGLLSGAGRETSARFSFFLSVPVILGSLAVSLLKSFADEGGGLKIGMPAAFAGFIASAFAGFFALHLMLRLIRKNNYKWFALYLAVLSVFTFILNVLQ